MLRLESFGDVWDDAEAAELDRNYPKAAGLFWEAAHLAPDRIAERMLLDAAWMNHERAAGRVSELETEP